LSESSRVSTCAEAGIEANNKRGKIKSRIFFGLNDAANVEAEKSPLNTFN
jgi:hypothetical protein